MRALLLILGAALVLSACSSANLKPPRELEPLTEPEVRIETLWSGQAGRGVGDQFLHLPVRHHEQTGYAADYQGYVKAFELATGKLKWERHTDLELATGAVYDNGRLYFGTRQGEVVALSAEEGELLWRAELSSEVIARPAVADGTLVARTNDGKLFALEAASGERRWVYDRSVPALTLRGNSAPVIVNDLVIAGSDNGRLSALVLSNGSVFWETAISYPSGKTELERMIDIDAEPVVVGDVVYAVTYQGRLAAVGSVDEIMHEVKTHSEVHVRVLGEIEPLIRWLGERSDLSNIRVEGPLLIFNHEGDRESEADLLKEMVVAGFRVAGFGSRAKSLEEVFMHVTRGAVQ